MSDPPSHEYTYQLLVQSEKSELLDFKRLNNIFTEWLKVQNRCGIQVDDMQGTRKRFVKYSFDGLEYLSTISNQILSDQYGNNKILNIKLPYDGFLYKNESEASLRHYQPIVRDRNIPNWFLVDLLKYQQELNDMLDWMKQYLSVGPQDNVVSQAFYNSTAQCFDIKMVNKTNVENRFTKVVSVTFEPGYPESQFEDQWQEFTTNS